LKNTIPLRLNLNTTGRDTSVHSMLGNDLALHFLDSGQILPLSGSQEYILGRSSDDQTEKPSIDLTEYQAYEKGVSRLHASIRKADGKLDVVDLGSSNRTRLNGNRLTPQQPYHLQHGDIQSLGKLKIQILIRR
jgi:pSer/pThr/pTyr-binding forkhead associated (FHA) protein